MFLSTVWNGGATVIQPLMCQPFAHFPVQIANQDPFRQQWPGTGTDRPGRGVLRHMWAMEVLSSPGLKSILVVCTDTADYHTAGADVQDKVVRSNRLMDAEWSHPGDEGEEESLISFSLWLICQHWYSVTFIFPFFFFSNLWIFELSKHQINGQSSRNVNLIYNLNIFSVHLNW